MLLLTDEEVAAIIARYEELADRVQTEDEARALFALMVLDVERKVLDVMEGRD